MCVPHAEAVSYLAVAAVAVSRLCRRAALSSSLAVASVTLASATWAVLSSVTVSGHLMAAWGKGGVLAAKAVETRGKDGVLAAKAVETRGKGGVLAAKAVKPQGKGDI